MRLWAAAIMLAISILLLGVSGYFLADLYYQERQDDVLMEQLKEIYEGNENQETEKTGERGEAGEASAEHERAGNGDPAILIVHPGLTALNEENTDCIGWIQIEGTAIDYPVMYHPEETDYYLRRDFYGEYSANGSLYLSEQCNPDTCDNLIIYGHHMKSGKMFASLEQYKDSGFCREHSLISFNTLKGEEIYQVFAVFCTTVYTGSDFPYYAFVKATNAAEYEEYVMAVKERSLYDTGITAVYGEKLLTLSTCEYSQKNGRIVVVAKKIR